MSQFERGIPPGMESLRLVKSSLSFDRENSMKWQKRREKDEKRKKNSRQASPSTKAKDKLILD